MSPHRSPKTFCRIFCGRGLIYQTLMYGFVSSLVLGFMNETPTGSWFWPIYLTKGETGGILTTISKESEPLLLVEMNRHRAIRA